LKNNRPSIFPPVVQDYFFRSSRYYILHTVYSGGTFAGVDVNTANGKDELLKAIAQIVHWAYAEHD